MSTLDIAEMFYSVQGEGRMSGKPAVFVRLAGCNLLCGAVGRNPQDVDPSSDSPVEGASWVCDTIDVWREADERYTPDELYNEFRARGWIDMLADGSAHLILTGGEPTLKKHQRAFIEFMQVWEENHDNRSTAIPYVEVETNGTIRPESEFDRYVVQYNVSLKLSNSGHSEEERINDDAVGWYAGNSRAYFKFVVGNEEDLYEIDELINRFGILDSDVMLMPAGSSQEQLSETYPVVAEMCKDRGWSFSPRLHVNIWDEMTGV